MEKPPDVISCANDDMALGALEALKARNLIGKVKLIGFDALPEALGQIKAGNMTATIEQLPGGQVRGAMEALVAYLRDGKSPLSRSRFTRSPSQAITLIKAERLNEVKQGLLHLAFSLALCSVGPPAIMRPSVWGGSRWDACFGFATARIALDSSRRDLR